MKNNSQNIWWWVALLALSLFLLISLAWSLGNARQSLLLPEESLNVVKKDEDLDQQLPKLKRLAQGKWGEYVENFLGSYFAIKGDFERAIELFTWNWGGRNQAIAPVIKDYQSTGMQQALRQATTSNWGGDKPKLLSEFKAAKILANHVMVVSWALTQIDQLEQQGKNWDVTSYNNLQRWQVAVAALSCGLYLHSYWEKLDKLQELAQKVQKLLDNILVKLSQIEVDDPLTRECIQALKQQLFDTRESFFLIKQMLETFKTRISGDLDKMLDDPLACVQRELSRWEELNEQINQLAQGLIKTSEAILAFSSQLDMLLEKGEINCQNLGKMWAEGESQSQKVSQALSKLQKLLNQPFQATEEGEQKMQNNDQKKWGNAKEIYQKIQNEEVLKEVEEQNLRQIEETLNQTRTKTFEDSLKNYFKTFWGKWRSDEGELNGGFNRWW